MSSHWLSRSEDIATVASYSGDSDGAAWSVDHGRFRSGPSQGVEVVKIDNGALCLDVLPTRGMGIWRGQCGKIRLGWDSPVKGPVHPAFMDLGEWDNCGWLRGFDEWLVRCGMHSNGAPCVDEVPTPLSGTKKVQLPLHGHAANIPASDVEFCEKDGQLSLRGKVREEGLFMPGLLLETTLTMQAGEPRFTVRDEIVNTGYEPVEMQMLYHINFGPPLLEKGARFSAPIKLASPRDSIAAKGMDGLHTFDGPERIGPEYCYFCQLAGDPAGRTTVLLRNAAATAGCALRFSLKELPCFSLWKNTSGGKDGYVTGLEPGTNYPNPKPFERAQGRVPTLQPGQRYSISVEYEIASNAKAVAAIEKEIAKLQEGVEARYEQAPVRRLSGAV